MSRGTRKTNSLLIYKCENKGADQLRSNCTADQRLCFRCIDRTMSLLSKSEICFCGCTAPFLSDLVQNPDCWFSHAQAHLLRSVLHPTHCAYFVENSRSAHFNNYCLLKFTEGRPRTAQFVLLGSYFILY